jgi:hypothetical protein
MSNETAAARSGTATPLGLLAGVALISASTLALETALTRYFSFRLWYHYAFMIISIASAVESGTTFTLTLPAGQG